MKNNYHHFSNPLEFLEILKKIDAITDPIVKSSFFKIVIIKKFSMATYFTSEIKINDVYKKVSFDINEVDCKIHHQKMVNGNLSKVQVNFNVNKAKVAGEIFVLLNKLFTCELNKKFNPVIYKKLTTMLQTQSKHTTSEGVTSIIEIEEPLGWITIKNMITVDKKNKTSTSDKSKFGGSITIMCQDPEKIGSFIPKEFVDESFSILEKLWPARAYVSGQVVIDNVTILSGNDIQLTTYFKKDTLVVLPQISTKNVIAKANNIKKLMLLANSLDLSNESDTSEQDGNNQGISELDIQNSEVPSDFDTF